MDQKVSGEGKVNYRAGFVGLIGQPNAGKSTLLNFLVSEKVSIVSSKPQTTRRRVLGIFSTEEGQAVFVDAPGIIQADRGLNGFLAKEAADVISESDALIAVLSTDAKSPEETQQVIDLVSASGKPWIGIVTKSDLGDKAHRVLILKNMVEVKGGRAFSIGLGKIGREQREDRESLLQECMKLLPTAPAPLYDVDLFTPENERQLVAEMVREKCFDVLHQEVPFGLAVRIVLFDESAEPCPKISAEILVAKDSHKGMVIGKGGAILKEIGTAARKDIEKLLSQKVFLDLRVTVREGWTDNKRFMKEMGYVVNDGE